MYFNPNILLFIFTSLTIFLCVERDGGHIKNDSHLWHSADAAFRISLALYVSYINFGNERFAMLFLSCYWLFFDMGLNIKRKLPLLYVGSTAWLDTLFTNMIPGRIIARGVIVLTVKIILMSISIVIFILWK